MLLSTLSAAQPSARRPAERASVNAASQGQAHRHWRNDLEPHRRTADVGGARGVDARNRTIRPRRIRTVRQHRRAAALTLDQWLALARRINTLFAERLRPRRHRRHERHRHARRDRLLPQPDRSQRQAGRRRRLDAQPEHARIRRRRQPARRISRCRRPAVPRQGRARRPQRRNQCRARSHQDRCASVCRRSRPAATASSASSTAIASSTTATSSSATPKPPSSTSRRSRRLPRVDVVMVYQGASGDVIKAMVDQGAKGIVIASAGAGATSGTQGEGIRYADRQGCLRRHQHPRRRRPHRAAPWRNCQLRRQMRTQTAIRRCPTLQATAGRFRIAAEDLAPLKARILLMLALTATKDGPEIQRMFARVLNKRCAAEVD